jgi:hypothetical protein
MRVDIVINKIIRKLNDINCLLCKLSTIQYVQVSIFISIMVDLYTGRIVDRFTCRQYSN